MKNEFWKQFLASLVRYVLFAIGGWMESHGIISHNQAEGFSSLEVAATLGGAILLGLPVWWAWAKANFNLLFQRALHRAEPSQTIASVKAEVLSENKNTVSV